MIDAAPQEQKKEAGMRNQHEATVMVGDKEYLPNARGDLVPIEKIKDVDVLRDQTVRTIVREVEVVSRDLKDLKRLVFEEADAFIALSFDRFGITQGGPKGNVTLMTHDGEYKVTIDVQDALSFDERLLAAKALIDKCIVRWSSGANANLRVLVNDAFRVDKKGNVDTKRILELRRYEIDDPDWSAAMAAIGESIKVTMSRRYLRVYRRKSAGDGYTMIPLDFASI